VIRSGEGGTFALLQGLFPKNDTDGEDRTLTSDSSHRAKTHVSNSGVRGRRFLDAAKWPLHMWSLFGTAFTLSDGIFTPGKYAFRCGRCLMSFFVLFSRNLMSYPNSRVCHQRSRWYRRRQAPSFK
jgi:hypothetical protein